MYDFLIGQHKKVGVHMPLLLSFVLCYQSFKDKAKSLEFAQIPSIPQNQICVNANFPADV